MARRFTIEFQDLEELQFFDNLSLEDRQITEIKKIASEYTRRKLCNDERTGIDLSYLTPDQKGRILYTKKRIVMGRNPDELRKQKRVVIAMHSQERMLERMGSNQLPRVLDTIQRIIDADFVLKAQFKGYSSLSYSLTNWKDRTYTLPISFKTVSGRRQILSVTLISRDAEPPAMTQNVVQDDEIAEQMAALKRNLVKRQHEK